MKVAQLLSLLALLNLAGCVGDDFILDNVAEEVRITNPIDSLRIGDTHQFEANYFNQIGLEEMQEIRWSSSDLTIMNVEAGGLATGLEAGEVFVNAYALLNNGDTITDQHLIIVNTEATSSQSLARKGSIQTTSSYALTGEFTLTEEDGDLVLTFGEDYRASSALPGLYVYMTNNPNSVNGAFEIGAVTEFSGAHSYRFSGVELNQFNHLLYWCKPFAVKVGDGDFDE